MDPGGATKGKPGGKGFCEESRSGGVVFVAAEARPKGSTLGYLGAIFLAQASYCDEKPVVASSLRCYPGCRWPVGETKARLAGVGGSGSGYETTHTLNFREIHMGIGIRC